MPRNVNPPQADLLLVNCQYIDLYQGIKQNYFAGDQGEGDMTILDQGSRQKRSIEDMNNVMINQ